jgi:hypothetical protein
MVGKEALDAGFKLLTLSVDALEHRITPRAIPEK